MVSQYLFFIESSVPTVTYLTKFSSSFSPTPKTLPPFEQDLSYDTKVIRVKISDPTLGSLDFPAAIPRRSPQLAISPPRGVKTAGRGCASRGASKARRQFPRQSGDGHSRAAPRRSRMPRLGQLPQLTSITAATAARLLLNSIFQFPPRRAPRFTSSRGRLAPGALYVFLGRRHVFMHSNNS